MKASILAGLLYAEAHCELADDWHWLTAPADIPALSPQVIRRLRHEYVVGDEAAVIPVHEGRRGHPVLLPGSAKRQLATLSHEARFDAIFEQIPTREIPCGVEALGRDLDTPEDFEA
jgi:molybdenum cofactor cytidylyltransferase